MVSVHGNPFMSPKLSLNNAAKGNLPLAANDYKRWFVYSGRLKGWFMAKNNGCPKLHFAISYLTDISINFYAKQVMEFTATAPKSS